MKTWIAALLLALIAAAAWAQGTPPAAREAGRNYRWSYSADSVTATTLIRFPNMKFLGDSIPPGGAVGDTKPDSIRTSGNGNAAQYVQCVMRGDQFYNLFWILYSSAFPAGEDTLFTNTRIPAFLMGGFDIDSAMVQGVPAEDLKPNITINVSD